MATNKTIICWVNIREREELFKQKIKIKKIQEHIVINWQQINVDWELEKDF